METLPFWAGFIFYQKKFQYHYFKSNTVNKIGCRRKFIVIFNLYNFPTALPRGFRSYLPLGEVGIAFSQFRVGQNTKFRFLALRPK